MGLDTWFNRKILRTVLVKKVKTLSWEQVLSGAYEEAQRFGNLISGSSEESAKIETAQGTSLIQETINLAGLNYSVAAKIDSIRNNRPSPSLRTGRQLELEAKSLTDARLLHEHSSRNLMAIGMTPVLGEGTAEHDQFGPLTAKEWLAVTSYYHELATRQVERLMRTPEYLNAQGKKW